MSRSKPLHDLQQLDLQRDAAVARLRQVVVALRGGDAGDAVRQALTAAEGRRDDLESQLRRVEAEREDLKARITAEEERLYAGRASHPKEIDGLRRSIAAHRVQLATKDDEALELLVARDEAREAVEAARAAVNKAEDAGAAERAALEAERMELARTVRALEPKLEDTRTRISAADRSLYERLRADKRLGGRVVVQAEGSACGGCGVQLARHTVIEAGAQSGLTRCPTCGRLLHA